MGRNGQMPLAAALARARGASPFSGDGAVLHRLADEVERMRVFIGSRTNFGRPGALSVLEEYDQQERRLLREEQGYSS